jgi:Domain of unknown function (DUF1843)
LIKEDNEMSSKKGTSGGKSSKKASAKQSASAARGGPLPPYGVPIREAIAGGNLSEMKAMATRTRKYIAELERALKTLDNQISKYKG